MTVYTGLIIILRSPSGSGISCLCLGTDLRLSHEYITQRTVLSHSVVSWQCKGEIVLKSSYVDFFPIHMTINFFAGKERETGKIRDST